MTFPVPTPLDNYRSAYAMPYHQVIVIGGSAGGIQALTQILALLPGAFRIPILVAQHLRRDGAISVLPTVLGRVTRLTVKWADHGEHPIGGTVYIAPCDHHLTVASDGSLELSSSSPRVNFCRPAIDPLFERVARVFGPRAIAIVLSGMLDDVHEAPLLCIRAEGLRWPRTNPHPCTLICLVQPLTLAAAKSVSVREKLLKHCVLSDYDPAGSQ